MGIKIGLMLTMLIFGRPDVIMKHKEWTKTADGNIVLYTRPKNYTDTPSPDSASIKYILSEARYCVDKTNKTLKTNFSEKINIYLFNYDEAEDEISTNAGGFAFRGNIYYTYRFKPRLDLKLNKRFYIGQHEFVHIVANYSLGYSNTLLFGEGYANALEGNYGSIDADSVLIATPIEKYINGENRLTLSEMLNATNYTYSENVIYPQAGVFIRWLISTYSIEKVNKLYPIDRKHFSTEFEKVTGECVAEMEKKYINYCDSIFK